MAFHSMVNFQNKVITVGGWDGTSSMSQLYQLTCDHEEACAWSKMSQELRIPRHDAVAMLIPDEALECT